MQRSCHLCVRLVRLYALPPSLTTNMGRYSQLSSKDWTAWQTKKKASHLLQSCTIAIGCEAIETQSTWPPKILSWEAATETHGHWVFLAGCHLSKSITIKFGVKLCSFESGLVKNLYQCHPFAFGLFSPLYYLSRYTCSWHFHSARSPTRSTVIAPVKNNVFVAVHHADHLVLDLHVVRARTNLLGASSC